MNLIKTLTTLIFLIPSSAAAAGIGDPGHGAALYAEQCSACHTADEDGRGPHHRGVVGRLAGSLPEFAYSDALATAGFVWSDALLDAWLADPQSLVPGQDMDVAVENAQDRADLIAYLKTLH